MTTPDMDVIRDIPGYKVILKAVLRAQIQNLVEQLATTTDEESVILTASVSDGTLSHLGSDSGKFFLEDHEDIKSQFLGFCLKRHHVMKQQEKDKKEKEAAAALRSPPAYYGQGHGSRGGYGRFPRMSYPRMTSQRGQSPGGSMRMPSQRFEPYHGARPPRKNSHDPGRDSMGGLDSTPLTGSPIVKSEPTDSSEDAGNGAASRTVGSADSPAHPGGEDDRSNSSSSTIPNEASDTAKSGDNQSQDSDANQASNSGAVDPNVDVKVEAISEADMELEITGVEPGAPLLNQSQDGGENWAQNISGLDLGFDTSDGAIGTQLDMQGNEQGYNSPKMRGLTSTRVPCFICGKMFSKKFNMDVHMKTHTGEKPWECEICHKRFTQKSNLKTHMFVHKRSLMEMQQQDLTKTTKELMQQNYTCTTTEVIKQDYTPSATEVIKQEYTPSADEYI